MSVEQSLNNFGKNIRKQSRSNLTRSKKNASGELYKSLEYKTKVSKNSIELSFYMSSYGKFVDKGVKGFKSSKKAPNSPYKFGTGIGGTGGLSKGINKWVRTKRIQFRGAKGRFLSYDSTAHIVARSVWNTGIKTTNFFTKPFEREFKKLPKQIIKAYGLEVNRLLSNAFK